MQFFLRLFFSIDHTFVFGTGTKFKAKFLEYLIWNFYLHKYGQKIARCNFLLQLSAKLENSSALLVLSFFLSFSKHWAIYALLSIYFGLLKVLFEYSWNSLVCSLCYCGARTIIKIIEIELLKVKTRNTFPF